MSALAFHVRDKFVKVTEFLHCRIKYHNTVYSLKRHGQLTRRAIVPKSLQPKPNLLFPNNQYVTIRDYILLT